MHLEQVKKCKCYFPDYLKMTDEISKSVKLPTFDGKSENFAMWLIKFQAFKTVKNFSEALV